MYVSIDLGGTNTRIASTTDLVVTHKVTKFDTHKDLNSQKKALSEAIVEVVDNNTVKGIAVGVAGLLDKKLKEFKKMPNLEYLNRQSFFELFENQNNSCPIVFENDAALAGLGEAVFGNGRDYETIAYITLSTGVGGVRIQNKKLDLKQKFYEPGHMVISLNGKLHPQTLIPGSLEYFASGTYFEDVYGKSPVKATDTKIWQEYAKYLGAGLINVTALWAPDAILLGGGLANKFDYFKDPLNDFMNNQTMFELPVIKTSKLGDAAGLAGGFALLKQIL